MSSDGSDSEYEGANHKTHSDSEGELDHKIQRIDEESAKGPQTPKSCSPRSQDSIGNSRDIGYQDDSRGLNSPLSDSQGAISNTQDQGPRSPSPTSYPQSPPRSPDSPAKSPQSFARSLQSPPKSPESLAKSFQSPSRSLQSPPQSLQSPPRSPQSLQRSSQSPPRSPQSPAQPDQDDDGRSDISSGSSLLSHQDNKDEDVLNLEAGEGSPLVSNTKVSPSNKNFPVSNADDLSDVSDLDDSDGLEDKEPEQNHNEDAQAESEKPQPEEVNGEIDDKESKEREAREKAEKERQEREKKNSLNMDDGEQLDFEADDQPEVEKEDGEIELGEKPKDEENKKDEGEKSGDEGEVKEDEESLEDGEVTDEGDPKPEKPPVCRFYSRGQCTWGINCRFLHPGVTDKGNYTMFDVGRPMVAPPNGPASLYPLDHRAAGYGHPLMVPPARVLPSPYGPIPVRREEPALVESAWERGLRQAKEMMRKSTKRKETDMDFEEKKMNLSIGQDEIDKENDYYTRAASPIDEPDPWGRLSPKLEPELRRPVRVVERYEDIIPEPLSPGYYPPEKYDYRRGGYDKLRDPEYLRSREKKKYYEEEEVAAYPAAKKSRREKMVREVIVQRVEKTKERHHAEDGTRRKADEWSDPWMRSKSPSRKVGHRSRKASYSSGSSSFSSRSGSRSSSNSSYTSYSRSRSRSLSNSRSPVSRSRRPRTPPFSSKIRSKKPSPPKDSSKFKPLKAASPVGGHAEKKITVERSMLMNPPAPTPKRAKERPLSPTAMRKVGLNPPPPTPKTKNSLKHSNSLKSGKIRSRKSRSSSGSGSSGSSSESSRSSYSSSSSSSRGGTPPVVRPGKLTKKIEPNESLAAQAVKGKAMDALKVSGQKPQIKLTLKPPETKRDKPALPPIAGKKRPAAEEAPPPDPKAAAAAKPPPPKKTTSRREELLKQLKAVEDAIARKRSKI